MPESTKTKPATLARVGDFLEGVNQHLPVGELSQMFVEELRTAPVGSKARTEMVEALLRTMNTHEKQHPQMSDGEIALLTDQQLETMLKQRLGVAAL